ncbi:uncharacterized protein BDV17DRAFT_255468 [Aspergillus undulatus]|uniref:uncharacterized protein n=1 Tax=Aspergillus undulatus TaxID=1810928 RepID=UPI003CCCD1B6
MAPNKSMPTPARLHLFSLYPSVSLLFQPTLLSRVLPLRSQERRSSSPSTSSSNWLCCSHLIPAEDPRRGSVKMTG